MGLVLALAPLEQAFGLAQVLVVTLQAVSGAGYLGVPSLDILGNVIPYIAKEEEKVEAGTRKLLGSAESVGIRSADLAVSAQCNRVAVEDGHTESVAVKLKRAATAEQIITAWAEFRGVPRSCGCPSRRSSRCSTTPHSAARSGAWTWIAEPA